MMNRRNFLATGLGGLAAASLTSCRTVSESPMAGTVPDVRDEFDLVVAGGSATGVFAVLGTCALVFVGWLLIRKIVRIDV